MQLSKHTIAILIAALGIASASPTPDAILENASEARGLEDFYHAGWLSQNSDQATENRSLTSKGNCWGFIPNDWSNSYFSMEIFDKFECKFYKNSLCWVNMPFGQSGELIRRGPWKGNAPSGWTDNISGYNCYRIGY